MSPTPTIPDRDGGANTLSRTVGHDAAELNHPRPCDGGSQSHRSPPPGRAATNVNASASLQNALRTGNRPQHLLDHSSFGRTTYRTWPRLARAPPRGRRRPLVPTLEELDLGLPDGDLGGQRPARWLDTRARVRRCLDDAHRSDRLRVRGAGVARLPGGRRGPGRGACRACWSSTMRAGWATRSRRGPAASLRSGTAHSPSTCSARVSR